MAGLYQESAEEKLAETIATLNDHARQNMGFASVVVTQGVNALPPAELTQIFSIIRSYRNWRDGDNPYGERDFGEIKKVSKGDISVWSQEPQSDKIVLPTVLFKIDYYAKADEANGIPRLTYGSERPECAVATDRVLTIMLADEY